MNNFPDDENDLLASQDSEKLKNETGIPTKRMGDSQLITYNLFHDRGMSLVS